MAGGYYDPIRLDVEEISGSYQTCSENSVFSESFERNMLDLLSGDMLVLPTFDSDLDPRPGKFLPESGDMVPESVASLCLHTLTLAGTVFGLGNGGYLSFRRLRYLMPFYLYTVGPPCTSGGMAGMRLFGLDDIISCVTQLLCLYVLLPENSVFSESFERNMLPLVFLVLNGTTGGMCVCSLQTK